MSWTGLHNEIGDSGSISLLVLLESSAKDIVCVAAMEDDFRALFAGFEAKGISKLCSPGDVMEGSNSNFCFVELADRRQADQAIAALYRTEK